MVVNDLWKRKEERWRPLVPELKRFKYLPFKDEDEIAPPLLGLLMCSTLMFHSRKDDFREFFI